MVKVSLFFAAVICTLLLGIVIVSTHIIPTYDMQDGFMYGLGVGLVFCGIMGYLARKFEKKELKEQ